MSHTNRWMNGLALAGGLSLCSGAVANEPPPSLLIPTDSMCWNVPDALLELGTAEIPPIPADFFGPGSDPFFGTIQLQGSDGTGGGCDIQIQRLADLTFPGTSLPEPATVPIEIVALDLVSVEPIVVQLGGEDTLWDVRLHVVPSGSVGDMTATREHTNGGSLACVIPIQPLLTFTRVDDPKDIREQFLPELQCIPPLPWPWVTSSPGGTIPNPPGCFLPPCEPPFCPPCPLQSQYGSLTMGVTQNSAVFPPGCVAPDDGTIGLPGPCPWLPIPGDSIRLPVNADSSMEMHFIVDSFFDIEYQIGGNFGPDGEIMTCQAEMTVDVHGTGGLNGFGRTLVVPVSVEVHWPCADPSAPQQDFPNEVVRLEGQLFGDPDFDLLLIEGGTIHQPGGGATGATRRRQLPSGNFNVESFFDIEYRIEWQGAPGSILEGFGNDPDDLCRHPLVQGGIPPLPANFFGMPHQPIGGATIGEDGNCDLIVSNIGSSGQDGVRVDLGEAAQGHCVELDLPAPGFWIPGSSHNYEGFMNAGALFKIPLSMDGNEDGSATLLFDPGSLPFEGTVSFAVLGADGSTVWNGPMPELVVGNIGSSGKDGVRVCMTVTDGGCCPPDLPFLCADGLVVSIVNPTPTEFVLDGNVVPGKQIVILVGNQSGLPTPPIHAACVSGANIPFIRVRNESLLLHCREYVSLDGLPPGEPVIRTVFGGAGGGGRLVVSNIGSSGCDGVRANLSLPPGDFTIDSFFDIVYYDLSVMPDPTRPGALHLTGVEPDGISRGTGTLPQMGVTVADNGAGGLDLRYLFGPDHPLIDVQIEARLGGAVQDNYTGPVGDPWAVIDGASNWPGRYEVQRIPADTGDEIMVLLRPAPGAANFMVTIQGDGTNPQVEADEIMIRGARPNTPVRGSVDQGPRRGSTSRGAAGSPSSSGFTGFEVTAADVEEFSIDDVITPLPDCPGDSNGDRTVNLADLLDVIGGWGSAGPGGDVNDDGTVNLDDLLEVIGNWGSTCVP